MNANIFFNMQCKTTNLHGINFVKESIQCDFKFVFMYVLFSWFYALFHLVPAKTPKEQR